MHFTSLALCALSLATLASSMQIARSSIDYNDPENRGSELRVDSGPLKAYGLDTRGGLEIKPSGTSTENGVQEPLLTKTQFVYNGGKDSRRQVSSSDESTGGDELFSPQRTRSTSSFTKRRLEGDAKNAAIDVYSSDNVGGTAGEDEPQLANIDKEDHGDGDHLLGGTSPKQGVDSPTGGHLVRTRRGVISVPAMKTIPEVLDMGRGRCRYPQRLGRGHVRCRPVW